MGMEAEAVCKYTTSISQAQIEALRTVMAFAVGYSCSGAKIEALQTVMTFTVAVGVAKTINFSYTITLSTCSTYVGFRPTILRSSFCKMEKLEARAVGLKPR